MTGPIVVPARRLTDAEALGHESFTRRFVALDGGTREIPVGGVTFGRPVARSLPTGSDRAVAVVEFPFDLDELRNGRRYALLRYGVELRTPGVVARSIWPRRAGAGADAGTFGVGDDLHLGLLPTVLTLRYEVLPSGVEGVGGETSFSWTFTAAEGEPVAASHRLFAVIELAAGAAAVDGVLVAEADIEQWKNGRFEPLSTGRVSQAFSVPLVACSAADPAVEDQASHSHLPTRGWQSFGPEAPPAPEPRPLPSGQVVSTGLAEVDRPDVPWPAGSCPRPGTRYLYWFSVDDAPDPGAIDKQPIPITLPPDTPSGTILTVVLFGFDGEIAIDERADTGELVLLDDGIIAAYRQPGSVTPAVTGRRLLFPIGTPPRPGTYRLRCNLYCNQTLLQSRLIEVDVSDGMPSSTVPAVRSTTDYVLETALNPAILADVQPLTLSVFMNDYDDGTHGFRLLGYDGDQLAKADVVLPALALQHLVDEARAALRQAAWVGGGEWSPGTRFRYDGWTEPDLDDDLIRLARAGYRMWTALNEPLARERTPGPGEPKSPILALRELMRCPGTVEFASKDNAGQVVPAALLYDYLLDPNLSLATCPTAMSAIRREAELATQRCFQGDCPHALDETVVCPGGFWGFRHQVGLPQSTRSRTAAEPPHGPPSSGLGPVYFVGRPHCVVGVASEFAGRHPTEVSERGDDSSRPVIADRARLLSALREGRAPHLVYLFCHGVSDRGLPALRVGPAGSDLIGTETIGDGRIYWADTRPLVVLNGCHTTAIEPRYAMNFVNAFVRNAGAAGVVGTEITTFESLAVAFGDLLIAAWFTPETGLGEAIRAARLGLLSAGNPLGLVYTSYATPQLRLKASTTA